MTAQPHTRSTPITPATFRVTRNRRRIVASEAVAALVAELVYGPSHDDWASHVTAPNVEAH